MPPKNGAAVVLRHGSGSMASSALAQAEVLARHGYGVLMTDARGHAHSGGRAMDLGWYGDTDIGAAVSFLAAQPEVDAERIAVVGLSMGGEEALGAAAGDPRPPGSDSGRPRVGAVLGNRPADRRVQADDTGRCSACGVADEGDAAAYIQQQAPENVTVWVVPEAGYTQRLSVAPAEWEQRVIRFLDAALAQP